MQLSMTSLLASMTRDKDCWTYVRKATKKRDGRTAFLELKGHYLGKNNVDKQPSCFSRDSTEECHISQRRLSLEL